MKPDKSVSCVRVLEDFHKVKPEIRERLRTELEEISTGASRLVVTAESTNKWSSAIRDRFDVVEFSDIGQAEAQECVRRVWQAEGGSGKCPSIAQLGVRSKNKHFSLRNVLIEGLQGYVDGGLADAPEKHISPSRRCARRVVELLSAKQKRTVGGTEAYKWLLDHPEEVAWLRESDAILSEWSLPEEVSTFTKYLRK